MVIWEADSFQPFQGKLTDSKNVNPCGLPLGRDRKPSSWCKPRGFTWWPAI